MVRDIDDVMSSVYERDYSAGAEPTSRGCAFRTRAELEAEIARLAGAR